MNARISQEEGKKRWQLRPTWESLSKHPFRKLLQVSVYRWRQSAEGRHPAGADQLLIGKNAARGQEEGREQSTGNVATPSRS